MFRFLVAEDVPDTLRQICGLLHDVFPDSEIDRATNVADARSLVQRRGDTGEPYDAAVLDFRLPRAVGSEFVIDTSVCAAISRSMPDVPVVHITSYTKDAEVLRHILETHQSTDAAPFVLVDKNQKTWGKTLVDELEKHLYSKRVSARLDGVFGHDVPSSRTERQSDKGRRHLTHELLTLVAELEQLWSKPLEERVRERVMKHFRHSNQGAGDRFTLRLPEESAR